MRIVIGGDIVPTDSNRSCFESGNMSEIIDINLFSILSNADARIFNLETPVCNQRTPIEKEGPCFSSSVESMAGIKALNPTLLTLANNHILDQGVQGLDSTVKALENYNIPFVGIGKNIADANRAGFIQIKGKRIGVYGCAEHEYTVATDSLPGANPFEPLEIADTIRTIRSQCDFLIVLYHGGKEYYEYPSPELQKRCHKMADCGADVIICQHSHCVGAYEEYHDSRVLYGQGNFILDRYVKAYEKYFQTSLLVELIINEDGWSWDFIPLKRQGCGVRLADDNEKREIITSLRKRSEKILQKNFIKENYKEYAANIAGRYIVRFSRFGFIFSALDTRFLRGGVLLNRNLKKLLGKHQRLAIQNCLQCEAHNEVIRAFLDNRVIRKSDDG